MESVTEIVTSTQAKQHALLGYLTCDTLLQGVLIARHAKTGLEELLTRAYGAVPQTGNTLVGVYSIRAGYGTHRPQYACIPLHSTRTLYMGPT